MRKTDLIVEDCCSWEEIYELFGCATSIEPEDNPAFHPDE